MGLTVSTLLIKGRHQRTSAASAHTAILILQTKILQVCLKKRNEQLSHDLLMLSILKSSLKVALVWM